MWLGLGISQTFLSNVFDVQNIGHVDTERFTIPVLDNPINKAVRRVLSKIQEERSHTMRVCRLYKLIFYVLFICILFIAFNYTTKG